MVRVDGSEPRTCSQCGESSEEFYFPLHHSPVCRVQRKEEIEQAVAEERERCAKIASEEPKNCQNPTDDYSKGYLDGALATAGAIRRRILKDTEKRMCDHTGLMLGTKCKVCGEDIRL